MSRMGGRMGKRWRARFVVFALVGGCGLAAGADVLSPAASGEGDPVRAWREAVAEPNTTARTQNLRALAPAVAEPDPHAALLLANTLGGLERDILIDAAWKAWGRQDAQAALAGLEELPELGTPQGCIVNGWPVYHLVEGWAQADPHAAFAWAVDSQNGFLADLPLRAIAESNVAEALGLAEEMGDAARPDAFSTVLHVWAEDDPYAAAAWLEDAAPEDAAWAFFAVARAWAGTSPAQALDWVHTLPAHLRLDATRPVINIAAEASPVAASGLLTRIHDPQRRAEATKTLVASWARFAPGEARRWIAHAVEDEARRGLYVSLFASWAKRDRGSAANELREIANEPHRDAAAMAILHTTADDLRIAARRAQDEGQPATALVGDMDFIEELYGRIRGAEAQQHMAKLLHDTFDSIAPARAERYRALAGVIDESQ